MGIDLLERSELFESEQTRIQSVPKKRIFPPMRTWVRPSLFVEIGSYPAWGVQLSGEPKKYHGHARPKANTAQHLIELSHELGKDTEHLLFGIDLLTDTNRLPRERNIEVVCRMNRTARMSGVLSDSIHLGLVEESTEYMHLPEHQTWLKSGQPLHIRSWEYGNEYTTFRLTPDGNALVNILGRNGLSL